MTSIADMHRSKRSSQIEKVVLYGTITLLLFGPLAFGAVEPWSTFVLEAGSMILFVAWVSKQVYDGGMKVRWNPLFSPLGFFGALIVFQVVFRTTSYPHDTIVLGVLYFAYALLCFLVTQTLFRAPQARSLALLFSVYGGVLAGFALLQGISSNGKLYWIRQPRMGGWIYGPYVNHNHYAGIMEMLVPIPLIVSLTRMAKPKVRVLAGVAAAVMVGTIFLSGSRGGMLAIVTELAILAVLLVQQRRGVRTAVGIAVFVVIVLLLLTWLGGSELTRRIATIAPGQSELSTDVRANIDRDTLHMFLRKPFLGWGLGTFPIVYPEFRTFYTNFFVNEAHNDYLQLLVEMGILGLVSLLWFVITVYGRALKKIANWAGDANGAAALACTLGLSGVLVHSAVDFNLQIPANAALFYVMCTVAAAEPFAKPARKRHIVRSKPQQELVDTPDSVQQSATNF
jgi:O-antigen ligase